MEIEKFAEILQNVISPDKTTMEAAQAEMLRLLNEETPLVLNNSADIIFGSENFEGSVVAQAAIMIGRCLTLNESIRKKWKNCEIEFRTKIVQSLFRGLGSDDKTTSNISAMDIGIIMNINSEDCPFFENFGPILMNEEAPIPFKISIFNACREICSRSSLDILKNYMGFVKNTSVVLFDILGQEGIEDSDIGNLLETLRYYFNTGSDYDPEFVSHILEVITTTLSNHLTTQVSYSAFQSAYALYETSFSNIGEIFNLFLPIVEVGFSSVETTIPALNYLEHLFDFFYIKNIKEPELCPFSPSDFISIIYGATNEALYAILASQEEFEEVPSDEETPISATVDVFKSIAKISPEETLSLIMTFFLENIKAPEPNKKFAAICLAEAAINVESRRCVEALEVITMEIIGNLNEQPLTVILQALLLVSKILENSPDLCFSDNCNTVIDFIETASGLSPVCNDYALLSINAITKNIRLDLPLNNKFARFQDYIFNILRIPELSETHLIFSAFDTLGKIIKRTPNLQFLFDIFNYLVERSNEIMSHISEEAFFEAGCKEIRGILLALKKYAERAMNNNTRKSEKNIVEEYSKEKRSGDEEQAPYKKMMFDNLMTALDLVSKILDCKIKEIFDDCQITMTELICAVGKSSITFIDKIMPNVIFGLQSNIVSTFCHSAVTVENLVKSIGEEFNEASAALLPILFSTLTPDSPLEVAGKGIIAIGSLFEYTWEPSKEFEESFANMLVSFITRNVTVGSYEDEVMAAYIYYSGIIKGLTYFTDYIRERQSEEGAELLSTKIIRPFMIRLGKMRQQMERHTGLYIRLARLFTNLMEILTILEFKGRFSRLFFRKDVKGILSIGLDSRDENWKTQTERVMTQIENS